MIDILIIFFIYQLFNVYIINLYFFIVEFYFFIVEFN